MFPLIAIPILVYSVLGPFGINMTTRFIWVLSLEDLLVGSALVFLSIEIWRSASPTRQTAKRLVADLAVLLMCIVEWSLPWPTASGTFAVLTIAAFVNLTASTYVAFVLKGQNNVWVSKS